MRCGADAVPCTIVDGEIVPDWLTAADVPWLRELLLVAAAFDGQPLASVRQRWRCDETPPRAGARWRPVLSELQGLLVGRSRGSAKTLRAAVFAATAAGASRAEALAAGAAVTGGTARDVAAALFADLGDQRVVRWPADLDPDALRRATNARFARSLLATATAAELTLQGQSRLVLRTAWLHGAHFRCRHADAAGARLCWRPPPGDGLAGRRLAALLPVLPWARHFVLRAQCAWRGRRGAFVLSELDALPPGAPPSLYDSRLEKALAAALVRACVGWDVLREPVPLAAGDGLAFPDFALSRGGESWWLELAGLRDPAALAGKVALLERVARYVLCLPARRCPRELVDHPRVVRFRRAAVAEVAEAVRAILCRGTGAASSASVACDAGPSGDDAGTALA